MRIIFHSNWPKWEHTPYTTQVPPLTDEQYEQAKAELYRRYPGDEGTRMLAREALARIRRAQADA